VNNNYNSNTVVKQDFAVVKQVDGQAAHMIDTTRQRTELSEPPPPDHAGSRSIPSLNNYQLVSMRDVCVQYMIGTSQGYPLHAMGV
jgi:hypothetical protein